MKSSYSVHFFDSRLNLLHDSLIQFTLKFYDDFDLPTEFKKSIYELSHRATDSLNELRASLYELSSMRSYLDEHASINDNFGGGTLEIFKDIEDIPTPDDLAL